MCVSFYVLFNSSQIIYSESMAEIGVNEKKECGELLIFVHFFLSNVFFIIGANIPWNLLRTILNFVFHVKIE